MGQADRQQAVWGILQDLPKTRETGLRELFWSELNYFRENKPLSVRQWPADAKECLADDPVLFASGGEDGAFHVIFTRLNGESLARGRERSVLNQLLRDHPYALFVFANQSGFAYHFLNVKYDQAAEKRRLVRRISVRPGEGLRTAAERVAMLDLQGIGISPLTIQQRHDEAFDVEQVTREFYHEIANWYFNARQCPDVVFPKDVETDEQRALFLIRLLTRLIFCWFLREKHNPATGKGLIPDTLFDPRSIQNLLKDASPESCSYYTAILQNLFFATLNTEMDVCGQPPTRRFIEEGDGRQSDDHMVHQRWRHARQLRDAAALEQLLRGIPFLNGGLFECLDDRVPAGQSPHTVEVRLDGFSTDPRKQPKLPNYLFFGAPRSANLNDAYGDTSHAREKVRPLLDILNRYHFTLTENTPFDQEVALDPELLGHVFENLLALYNPETGSVARKATGSFYTPRVVVDWMVDQALLVYLKGKLSSSGSSQLEKKLKRLLDWEAEGCDFSPAETNTLIDALDNLKAIDPACGSGAFPMGLLQKLVHVLKKLDPGNEAWRERQVQKAEAIESGPAREEALKAINRAFARDNDDYGRKLYLIENGLFGVDIQPIAVQIAKLRFFISLVVDQAIDPNEPNLGILPLPNLETKVVAANTLLGLHRGQLLLGSDTVKRLERALQKVRHDYFTARSYKRKKDLRKEDRRLCEELAAALESSGECTPYDAKRLAGWNPYDTMRAAPFFDPGWMFGMASKDQDGVFDLVLGNPPYVRQEELKNQMVTGSDGKPQPIKDALKAFYECFTGTADLYVYFFERSLQLLRTGGVLSFITSNKWFRAAYGERLRTYLAYATQPSVLLDFGDAPVFTSIAYPAILVTQKKRKIEKGTLPSAQGFLHPGKRPPAEWGSHVMTWKPGPDIREFPDIFEREAFALAQRDLKPDGWRMESPVRLRLLEKLRNAGTPLGEYVKGRFYYGIKTGLNDAFVVNRETRDRLVAEHASSREILKPFLRGRDVKRWRCESQNLWLIFTRRGIDIKKYPAIHEHLKPFKKQLMPGAPGGRKPGSYEWYEIQDNVAYWKEFEHPKVIYPDIYEHQSFAWDETGFFSVNTTYFIPTNEKWLLPLLNSSAVEWFYSNISNKVRGGYMRAFSDCMMQIPIPAAVSKLQAELEKQADQVLAAKKADPSSDVTALEREIDERVYSLYGLSKEEIRIVEGEA